MYAYYKLLDEVWGGKNIHAGYVFNAIGPIAAAMWIPETIAKAKSLLDKAAKECAADARALRQVVGEKEMFERDWVSRYENGMALKQSGSVTPAINGKPWRLGAFKGMNDGRDIPAKTAAWLSTDGKSLTVRLQFREDTKAYKAEVTADNDWKLYADDCVEIFLEPATVVPGEYYHFVFNSKGVKLLAKGLGGMRFDRSFKCDWTVKSELSADTWDATESIPFSAFPHSPAPTEKPWKIGIVRTSSAAKGLLPSCGWPGGAVSQPRSAGQFQSGDTGAVCRRAFQKFALFRRRS